MKHSNSIKSSLTHKHIKGTTPAIQAASNEAAHSETPQTADASGALSKTKFADRKNLVPKSLHASDFLKDEALSGAVEQLFTCLKGRQKPSHLDQNLYKIIKEILEKELYLLEKKKDGSPRFPTPDAFIERVAKVSRTVLREHTSESCQKNSYRQINAAKVFFLLKTDIPDTPIPLATSVLTILGRCSRGNRALILKDALDTTDATSITEALIIEIAKKYGEKNLPKPRKPRSPSKQEASKRWILFQKKASKYSELAADLDFFTKLIAPKEKPLPSGSAQNEEPSEPSPASPPAQLPSESQPLSATSKTETEVPPQSETTNPPKPVPQQQPKQAPKDAGVEVLPLPEHASPTEELPLLAGFFNEQSGQATL